MNISITISGDKEVIKKLGDLQRIFGSWKSELRDSTDFMKKYYSTRVFDLEGQMFGQRWAPVKPAYDTFKRTHAMLFGTLQFSGKMQGSFDSQVGDTEAEVSNSASYFVYHQSSAPRTKLPRRKMIGIDETQKRYVLQVFRQGVTDKIKQAGF
jgi:phage gpG-like protein